MSKDYSEIAYKHTRFFVEECGERIAGTAQMNKAAEHAVEVFRSLGMKYIQHHFQVPVCSTEKSVVELISNKQITPLPHTNMCFCTDTPEGGLTAEAVLIHSDVKKMGVIGEIYPISDKCIKTDIKGKIVVIERSVLMDYPDIDTYKVLEKNKPAAVIFTTDESQQGIPYVYSNFEYREAQYMLPSFIMNKNDVNKLFSQNDKVILHVELKTQVQKKESTNTIGVIEGTDKQDEVILISGHLDSAVSSKGAVDDAGAIGTVMALAEKYKALSDKGVRTHRTLYFACWSGHEPGLHGSKYFLQQNQDIYKRIKYNINYDIIGMATPYSITYAGVKDFEAIFEKIFEKCGSTLDIFSGPVPCDTLNLTSNKIPSLTMSNGGFVWGHTPADDMKNIDKRGFDQPIDFSSELINYLDSLEKIPQGYTDDIEKQLDIYATRYGWDF